MFSTRLYKSSFSCPFILSDSLPNLLSFPLTLQILLWMLCVCDQLRKTVDEWTQNNDKRWLIIHAVWRRNYFKYGCLTNKFHLCLMRTHMPELRILIENFREWVGKPGRNIYKPNTKVKETHQCDILVKVTLLPCRRRCHVYHFLAPSTSRHFLLCSLNIVVQYWPPAKSTNK